MHQSVKAAYYSDSQASSGIESKSIPTFHKHKHTPPPTLTTSNIPPKMSSTQPTIQSLPNEILFKIASELSNKKDVVAFCCTSNQFCGIALPQLYSSFHHTIELQELDQTISKWNKRKPLKGFAKHGWYTR